MNENMNRAGAHLLQTRRNHRRWTTLVLLLAILVSTGTFFVLRHSAIAATYKKRVLDCQQISGTVAHIHNDDCYDKSGLVCTLEEIAPHLHSSECYEKELVCSLGESAGHIHTEECWAEETDLVCGQDEHIHGPECYELTLVCGEDEALPEYDEAGELVASGHVHTDACYGNELVCEEEEHVHSESCYETSRYTVCGMEEGEGAHQHDESCYVSKLICGQEELPVHIHDANCFITVDLTPEEVEAMRAAEELTESENAADETADSAKAVGGETLEGENTVNAEAYPAQQFEGEAAGLLVTVNAPAGAFPKDTEMVVSPIEDENVLNAATAEVQGEVVLVQGVDISFYDADGNEIEPLLPIQVEMVPSVETAPSIPDMTEVSNEQTLVHVDNELSATVVEQEDKLTPEVRFESDSFSAYIVIYTKIEKTVLASDGNNYRITVTCDPASGIPIDADLAVEEILSVSELYDEYVLRTESALGSYEKVTFARFFDICLVKDGMEIQPSGAVNVKIEMADDLTKEVKAIHFGDEVEVLDTTLMNAENLNGAVEFKANGFSVYGVVLTEIIRTDFLASDGSLYDVTVRYNDDAQIPEGSILRVTEINQGTAEYNNAYQLIFNEEPSEDAPMMAVDISIIDPEGLEIEPKSAVKVEIIMKAIPDGVDAEEIQATIAISHMKEVPGGIIVETVASGSEISVGETIEASFVVDSFSQFNITWNNSGTRATVLVHYVDEEGYDLEGQHTTNINYTNNNTTYYFADYASEDIDGASFIEARLGSSSGNKVTSVSFVRSGTFFNRVYTTTFYNGSTQIDSNTNNQTYNVYLVYENVTPGLTISKTSSGATTPAATTFTVSSTDGEYTRTFTYADMTNGKIKFENAPTGKTYIVSENGGERNGYLLTTTYGSNVTLTESRPYGTLAVNNTYANDPNVIKVYVYVAAYDQEGNQFKNNPEFLELLGISGDTVDGNGYFPVGEIYIDKSFLNGKTTNKWAALINSSNDWEQVLAALGELDTSTLIYDQGTDYSLNRGNNVGDYMDQAIGDVNKGAGSQCTALFGWSGHSYGFADQSVEYHLDLRFQTNKVTFITGNNGISSGASRDGTTVDVRAYIQGSAIQQPRNLIIPAGYRLVGYYNDPIFTTPWNKIGTPITQDEVAYIKITPQDNVILYYKPVPAGGGTVSLDAEGLNPVTGTPAGSTATANPGYTFVGWYADEGCTQLLSTNATYVPTKTSNERWVDWTTYYARFRENTVTLTFIAEDHIDHLEMNSIPENVVSYEFSDDHKTLTVVLEASSGSPVTVTGIPEIGYAVKEWTIDGRTGNLTTNDSLITSKTDDPAATNELWTDRTYHVWAEVLKTITVTKEVNIIGTLEEEDVDVTVFFALKDLSQNPAPWVYNADGSIYTTSIQIVDGIPNGTAQFVDLPAGTYEVWEVADENAGSLGPGSEIAPGIVLSRIQTWISDTDTGNDVILTDDDPDGSIKVINTFNHAGEAMTFWANKKWFTVKNSYTDANAEANVGVPAGAWVDFTLYRVYADGREEKLQTIRLDGSANAVGEEEPWAAAFRDLPTVDHVGNPFTYYVKETAMADLFEYDYYTTFNDTTYTNGGSISNVVAYGDVSVTKEIELPADITAEDKQAFIDALTITIVGPSEVREDRRITRTLDNNSFTVTEAVKTNTYGQTTQSVTVLTLTATAEDLPAGTYTVTEAGYNDSSLGYQWDSAHSWIKSDKLSASESSLINKEQYGKVSIDVPIGINVTDNNFTTTVNLLNSYVVQDIKATKVWNDLGLTNADHPSVSMTLYRTDGSGNKTSVSTQIIGANQTGDNLTLTWPNQPQIYTYSVEEATVEGYTLESITGNAAEGFVVTNKKAAVIKIVKTDQGGNPLAGAEFSSDLFTGNITTEITGEEDAREAIILDSTNVSLGTYTLTEVSPPAGYNALGGPIAITVAEGAAAGDIIVSATINGQTSVFARVERVHVENQKSEWIITIRNDAGVVLPQTGGEGYLLFSVLGTMMVLTATIGLMAKKRRETACSTAYTPRH